MKKIEYQKMFEVEKDHWWFLGKRIFSRIFLKKTKLKRFNILDLGSGTGGMTYFLKKFGTVVGVEENKEAVDFCKKRGLKVINNSINEKLPFRKDSFNLVTIFDVLYHKNVNEKKVLQQAHGLLKNNGFILISDCALPFFWSSHDENMMAKKRFLKNELENLLEKQGFKIIKSSYIYFFTFPLFALNRIFLKINKTDSVSTVEPINKIFNWFLFLITSIEAYLLNYLKSFPIGSSIMILAKKV